MKSDNNWKITRVLAEDLSNLLGISVPAIEEFLKIVEDLLIHKFVEELLDQEETTETNNNEYQIELPYLGSLIISLTNNHISTNFAVRPIFYRKIKSAYLTKNSPLIEDCTASLSEELLRKFEENGSIYKDGEDDCE